MKGQRLLDGTLCGFAPETIADMRQAFDVSWATISARYHEEAAISEARVSLANIVVSLAAHGVTDIAEISRISIDLFDLIESYKHK